VAAPTRPELPVGLRFPVYLTVALVVLERCAPVVLLPVTRRGRAVVVVVAVGTLLTSSVTVAQEAKLRDSLAVPTAVIRQLSRRPRLVYQTASLQPVAVVVVQDRL
jgi:hypothetical protein